VEICVLLFSNEPVNNKSDQILYNYLFEFKRIQSGDCERPFIRPTYLSDQVDSINRLEQIIIKNCNLNKSLIFEMPGKSSVLSVVRGRLKDNLILFALNRFMSIQNFPDTTKIEKCSLCVALSP